MSVAILRPNAVGTYNEWAQTPGTGNHYDKVDEVTADGDTTYVSVTSISNANVQPFLRLGATDLFGTDVGTSIGAYTQYSQEIGRPGGGLWSTSDIDSLEIGVRAHGTIGDLEDSYNLEAWASGPATIKSVTLYWVAKAEYGGKTSYVRVTQAWIVVDYGIGFRSATEAGTGSASTNLQISVPSGVTDGDFMLLFGVTADGDDGGFDPLTGWTEIVDAAMFLVDSAAPSPPGMSVWWRIADSEPGNYTITPTAGSTGICAQMLLFSGVDPTVPTQKIKVETSTTASGNSANADPPSIDTVTDNAMIVVACMHDSVDITTHTVPTGYIDPDSLGRIVGSGGGNGCTMGAAYGESLVSPAGTEDPPAFTTSSEQWGAVTVALRPISGEYEQEGYRWRDDDGSESSASWLESQDVDINRALAITTRLRIIMNATEDVPTGQMTLQYKRNDETASEWRDI